MESPSRRFLDAEVTPKVGLVAEQEVERFYQANKGRLQGEEVQVKDQIRGHLQSQKLAAQREAFLKPLRSHANVVVHLKAPPIFRAQVSAEGGPFRINWAVQNGMRATRRATTTSSTASAT